jgi:hypothetical protein
MNEPVPSLERFPSDRNMKYRYGLIALAIMVLIGIGAVGAFQIRQVVSRQSLFRVHRTSYYSIAAPYEWEHLGRKTARPSSSRIPPTAASFPALASAWLWVNP